MNIVCPGVFKYWFTFRAYFPVTPGRARGSEDSSLLMLFISSSDCLANPPNMAPKIGANTRE